MTLDELLVLMQRGNISQCMNTLELHCIIKNIYEAVKEYDPCLHKINDKIVRPDKAVTDEQKNVLKIIPVARIAIPIQKKIVLTAASFLGTPEISATPQTDIETTMINGINRTWESNKLDYSFRQIAKRTMSELHCAELWSLSITDPFYWDGTGVNGSIPTKGVVAKVKSAIIGKPQGSYKLSMQIISRTKGDTMYPVFDQYGDMIAFGRGYSTLDHEGKKILHFDVYTANNIYYSKQEGQYTTWADINMAYSEGFKGIPNVIGKIPVIYYSQPLLEWQDVQPLIERLEVLASNHADTNDYSGSPIVVASGEVEGFADKGEQGKLLQVKNGATVTYLTFDGAPESIRMEMENLKRDIYSYTHTPDINFENVKGLGTFSGIAFKMFFLDAHLKAADKEEIFGEGLQRRINYLKTALSKIDGSLTPALPLQIKPKFHYFLPSNYVEDIDNLVKLYGAGLISLESAVKLNPLVTDPDGELEALSGPQIGAVVSIAPGKEKQPSHKGQTFSIASVVNQDVQLMDTTGALIAGYVRTDLVAA